MEKAQDIIDAFLGKMDELEELGGPDKDTYVIVMAYVRAEADKRLAAALGV